MPYTYETSERTSAARVSYKNYMGLKTHRKRHGMEREDEFQRDSFNTHPGLCGVPTISKDAWNIYFSHLKPGDKILVGGKVASPYYIWHPIMDSMVGKRLTIRAIDPRGAVLIHPDQSSHFSFPLKSLDYKNTEISFSNGEKSRAPAYGDSEHYNLGIPNSEALSSKKGIISEIKKGNILYKLINVIEINTIKHVSLSEDYTLLYKIYQGMYYLSLEAKYFDAIKEQCPRIIGVLLSCGFMTKSVVEEQENGEN